LLIGLKSVMNKLFSTDLISQEVQNAMPSGMVVRPLEAGDFEKGKQEKS
jgi:hypothetical protein